jgi:hypothetical protein
MPSGTHDVEKEDTMNDSRIRATVTWLAISGLVLAGCTGGGPTGSTTASTGAASAPSPTTVATPTPQPSPTAVPSPSGVSALGASGSGTFGPGTYTTAFQPPLRFTLAELTIVGADGKIAYESIGEDDVNEPGWVDIAFGFDKPKPRGHGTWSADFFIDRVDKVFDPKHPGTLIEPPKDLAAWIRKLPGLTLTAPPKAVEIGGHDATQLDVVTGDKEISIGPIPGVSDPAAFGFGPHSLARIVVVSVDGHEVLIVLGPTDSAAHFKRAVAALQPLVDSIVWR